MQYMGGKSRIAKHILPIILKDRKEEQWYIEPFCGGCNTLSKVTGNRIGADNNTAVIGLWKKVSLGWLPPEYISIEIYNLLKGFKDDYYLTLQNPKIGYVGFACSFGGKYFGGYAKNNNNRNYSKNAYNSALKQFPKLRGVIFHHCSYENLIIPENSIIYCDPPYKNTTKYSRKEFDYKQFWEQCRNWVFDGHKVFISEYNAPDDFICVWQKEITNSLNDKKAVEKLFVYNEEL